MGSELKLNIITPFTETGIQLNGAIRFPVWATSTGYSANDAVIYNYTLYICTTAHTSGTFETDRVTSGYWVLPCPVAVGNTYTQYPTAASNAEATAFPVSERPAALYGGTWEQIWNTDAVFWRTEGDFHASDAQNTNRTNGKQTHQMQAHLHNLSFGGGAGSSTLRVDRGKDTDAPTYISGTASANSSPSTIAVVEAIADATHGTPLLGYENRPQNRLIKLWKRTA